MSDVDERTATELDNALCGLNYRRSTAAFTPPKRRTSVWLGTATVVVAIAIGAVVFSPDATDTAYGWEPTPRVATPAERAAARHACDVTTTVTHNSDGTTSFAFAPNTSGTPSMTLETLDIRGNTYLATLHNAQTSTICQVAGLNTDPHVIAQLELSQPGATTLAAIADTTFTPDVAVIAGFTPANASSVEIDVAGLPTVHADVNESMFAAWVPAASWRGTATVRAYDDSGTLIATTDRVLVD